MATRLADQLVMARQRQVVGREAEQSLFRSALAAAELPFHVLFCHGIGGLGKTTLLRAFGHICQQFGTPVTLLDARGLEPSPAAVLDALRQTLGLASSDSPLAALADRNTRQVLLLDSYEALTPLDTWIREQLLPELPASMLVVITGRRPPALAWQTDPGWASLMRVLPLDNLNPRASLAYLSQRGVPVEHHAAALDFTHGHPLALSLVADVILQRPAVPFQPEAAPDVLHALLQQFREQLPGPAQRAALEACAVVRTMTEPLLAEMTEAADAHALFGWLRELSFVDTGPPGLFLHDLARDVLAADLRWRDPEGYARFRRRAATWYIARLEQGQDWEQERLLSDLLFLHGDSPVIRPLLDSFEWQGRSGVYADTTRESDVPAIVALVARHEGDESARLAAHWLARQRDRTVVFRESAATGEPGLAGFVMWLALHEASTEDRDADPATRIAWQHLGREMPLRGGDGAAYRRFEMVRDTYQSASPLQSLNVLDWERRLLTMPWRGPVYKAYADAEFWTPMLAYAEIARIPAADFEVGGRRYAAYGLDTRVLPPITRWTRLTDKLIGARSHAEPQPFPSGRMEGLSQAEFAEAVRNALRDYAQPDRLHRNPLLRTRLVRSRAGADEAQRLAACRTTLQQAVEALRSSPRQHKWYRALYHTYLHPAPTQEQAAELLGLPFNTYRYQLRAGIQRVTELMWQWELDAARQ